MPAVFELRTVANGGDNCRGCLGADAFDLGDPLARLAGTEHVVDFFVEDVPLTKVVDLYREHGPSIFRRRLPDGLPGIAINHVRRPAALEAGDRALRNALEAQLGQTTIREVYDERGIALAINAVELSQHRAWVFKTPHFAATNHRDDDYGLVDICLATSAAPIFRSMAAISHPGENGEGYHVFVDGGLWSLGTCPMPSGEQIARGDVHRGLADWKFGGDAASLAIDAQQITWQRNWRAT